MKLSLLCRSFLMGLGLVIAYAPIIQSADSPADSSERRIRMTGDQFKKLLKDVKDLKKVTPFVQEQLGKAGCTNPESILVMPDDQYSTSQAGIGVPIQELAVILKEKKNRNIKKPDDINSLILDMSNNPSLIPLYQEPLFRIRLTGNNEKDFQTLAKGINQEVNYNYLRSIGALRHEGNHYKNNDVEKIDRLDANASAIAQAINMGSAVTCSAALGAYVLGYNPNLPVTPLTTCKNFLAASLFSHAAKPLLKKAYMREKEWSADENIPDDPAILRARAEQFRREDRDTRKHLRSGNEIIKCLQNIDPLINLTSNHPRHAARQERFTERAKAAEQGKPRPARSCAIS